MTPDPLPAAAAGHARTETGSNTAPPGGTAHRTRAAKVYEGIDPLVAQDLGEMLGVHA